MNRKQRRAAKIAAQQAIVDGARAAGRDMTPEEQAQFDSLQREIETLTAEIAEEERQLQASAGAPAQGVSEGSQGAEDPAAATRQAVEAERQRIQDITALCRQFDADPADHIAQGHTMDQVRQAILDGLCSTGTPTRVQVTRDEGDTFRSRASDGLLLRSGANLEHPTEGADQFRSMSLRDLAIECLSREGQDVNSLLRMSSDDLYTQVVRQFYNPTAAFPAILDQTIEKSIVHLYNMVPTTFQQITTKGSLKDFKETADHEYVIGGVGDFLLVPENGEIKPDLPRTELLPQRKLDTYAKQFSMTRQAFINDDIGFLTEVPGLYATKAKQTIDKQVYKLLFGNAKIFDGKQLFSADHGNLMTTASKPSQASIQAIITKMQMQKDQFGEPIYITPRTIVVPVGWSFDLTVILGSTHVTGSGNNDINPLYNYPLQIVQTPMLNALAGEDACPWFMFADASSARGIQVDYLNGQETPTVRRMEVPGTLGFIWDIYLDWGISVRDFRGIAMNPGVALDIED